jgi:acyl-CoA synthetase (AMP-forming)/AMP-acid ligase II/acyl carrier protein
LDRQARTLGAFLQSLRVFGKPALLLYPPGLEYIAAFFGCLYAGVLPAPAYPPRRNRPDFRIQTIVADMATTVALTTTSVMSDLNGRLADNPALKALQWLTTDSLDDDLVDEWRAPVIRSDTLALLQYTSGSTGAPKGVMVTHGNLLNNLRLIYQYFDHVSEKRGVSWLPPYHDMGLIGGMLQPVYGGFPVTLMSPIAFQQRPVRWLQAIGRYRATSSAAPNFAYDLCVRKITPEQRATLNLSSWKVAFNGAEPVNYQTIERFANAFEPYGFRREAFCACYGLAEATLLVSGGMPPILHTVEASALQRGEIATASAQTDGARTLVGCGQTHLEQEIVIVEPTSLNQCPSGMVGEIWVSGPSVAQGYWNQAEETETRFHARLSGSEKGRFLRTGDLGFLIGDELFVTGRLKELIVVRGRNHYPHDIERTVEESHPALQPAGSAAFTVEVKNEERLVIVQELKRNFIRDVETHQIVGTMRQSVFDQHGLEVHAVALVRTGCIPRSSSGKIRRDACRTAFLIKSLEVVGEWAQSIKDNDLESFSGGDDVTKRISGTEIPGGRDKQNKQTIQTWLVCHLSARLGIESRAIDVTAPLASYGLDSVTAVSLTGDLEDWLGIRLSATMAFDYPTIDVLSQAVAEQYQRSERDLKQGNTEMLSQMVAELEQLSEEEVQSLLIRERNLIQRSN